MSRKLSWVEVDAQALRHNIGEFRRLVGPARTIMAVVKANAYGHGLAETARTAVSAGAEWLGVFDLDEAVRVRETGIESPVLIMGDVARDGLAEAIARGFRLTIPSTDMAARVTAAAHASGRRADVHLKVETGTNRQGMPAPEAAAVGVALEKDGAARVEGVYTHFANIEDTTDHSYALRQLENFNGALGILAAAGVKPPIRHSACSAATILFPETYFEMVRMGIGMYGLWPSRETRVSALRSPAADGSAAQRGEASVDLRPALAWKTRVIQVKEVAEGAFVGYGCTFRATRRMRIAVLPVGYCNGYDRGFSNTAYVLVRGRRAAVTGRVCMNLTMIDVTDIPEAAAGDETVLLGAQGGDAITADQLAGLIGTINYEIVARLDPSAPRVLAE